jgi:hypothetical protein
MNAVRKFTARQQVVEEKEKTESVTEVQPDIWEIRRQNLWVVRVSVRKG